MLNERALVMIKPDGVERNLTGRIIQRIEDKDFYIRFIKKVLLTEEQVKNHYKEHSQEPSFHKLITNFLTSRVVVMVIEGCDIIIPLRLMIGATDPKQALSGTIRGDYGTHLPYNVIHVSDCVEAGEYEVDNIFGGV